MRMTEAFLLPLMQAWLFWATPGRNGIIYGDIIVLALARGEIKSGPSVTPKEAAFHLDWDNYF